MKGTMNWYSKQFQSFINDTKSYLTVETKLDTNSNEQYKYYRSLFDGCTLNEIIEQANEDHIQLDIHNDPFYTIQSSSKPVPITKDEMKKASTENASIPAGYEKYFKMKKVGIPIEAIKMKIKQDGLDPSIIDQTQSIKKEVLPPPPSQLQPQPQSLIKSIPASNNQSSIDPQYKKYWILYNGGQPLNILEMKIKADHLDFQYFKQYIESHSTIKQTSTKREKNQYDQPPKQQDVPSVPLKALYWIPVKGESLKNSIWLSFEDHKVNFNMRLLEVQFKASETKEKQIDTSPKQQDRKVSLLDPKREYNCSILFANLKMSINEVVEKITCIHPTIMIDDILKILIKLVPTNDEINVLTNYQGERSKLNEIDQLFLSFSTIPNLRARLICLELTFSWIEDYDQTKNQLIIIYQALNQLKNSREFKLLLVIILRIGNYMNGIFIINQSQSRKE